MTVDELRSMIDGVDGRAKVYLEVDDGISFFDELRGVEVVRSYATPVIVVRLHNRDRMVSSDF